MKKYFYIFLSFLILNTSISSMTPQKMGDVVNLVITTVVPYSIKAFKLSQKNLSPKEFVKKLFSPKMITYLVSMFLTQKYLWQYGSSFLEKHFSTTDFSVQSTSAWILFGGLVGLTSLKVGSFIAYKIKQFTQENETARKIYKRFLG